MKNKNTKDYCVGLDVGTGSVGWAAVDENYKILRLCGKDAWGVLLMDNAKTAQDRRLKRSMRRRYARRRERIRLLQEIFAPLIAPIDESFFIRLKESSLHVGEGDFFRSNRYNIFDGAFTDKDYYKKYPTIYHLRHALATQTEQADIRLVYLAIHHIIKYRGHFLREGSAADVKGGDVEQSIAEIFALLKSNYYADISCDPCELADILTDKNKNRAQKQEAFIAVLPKEYKTFAKELAGALVGDKFWLGQLFSFADDVTAELNEVRLSFSDTDYEEKEEEYLALAADKQDVLSAVKGAYSALALAEIMRGQTSISQAMMARYNKHVKDLRILKRLFRESFSHEEYKAFFRNGYGVNYVRYVGDKRYDGYFKKVEVKKNGPKYSGKIPRDVFYTELENRLNKTEHPDKQYCMEEKAKGDFLPLINSVANAYIPYQLNLAELTAILDLQSRYYPQLENDREKIISLLTFRRPYYVGTLKGPYSWNQQQIEGRVTPWNFFDKVDSDKLAEAFIVRMTNRCTIFPDEECLPKNSITWQKYVILNAINKLTVHGVPISVKQKQAIFDSLCLQKRKVTKAQIAKLLCEKFNMSCTKDDIGGLSNDSIDVGMNSYIDFKMRLGNCFDENLLDVYEESIRTLTIFDDVKLRKRRLKRQNAYTDSQVEALCKLKYSGWGSFSRKALRDTRSHNGENIMQLLYESNRNFQELRFDKTLGFLEAFAPQAERKTDVRTLVEEMHCSPIVKKTVRNAIRILKEITDAAGKPPKAIFLENTHEDAPKKKKDSRVKQLKELYKRIKNSEYFNREAAEALQQTDEDKHLTSDAFFLWLLQLGRCMYTEEAIPLDELKNGHYQIDHIVPQCYIKDDSFDNRVLIKTFDNANKTGTLGLNPEIIKKRERFWEFLHEKKFISDKKLRALRKDSYDENDRIGFIQRQLVDTSYAVKEIQDVLKQCYPETEVRGVKAGLNSTMRKKYRGKYAGFYKIRSLNNFHHAKDAYLTATLGMFTTYACPLWGHSAENRYYKRAISEAVSGEKIKNLVNKRYGIILDLMDSTDYSRFEIDENGEYAWSETRMNNVFKTMAKNTCLVVKKQEPIAEAEFYNQTIISPRSPKNKSLIPLKSPGGKSLPVNLYGGYTSLNPAYFAILRITDSKNKSKLIFGDVPAIELAANRVDNYIRSTYGDDEKGISAKIVREIRKYQLVECDGQRCYISGKADIQNATELYVNARYEKLLWLADVQKAKASSKNLAVYQLHCEEYDALFEEFVDYYCNKVRKYYPLFAKLADKLQKNKTTVLQLPVEKKLDLLSLMMKVASSGAGRTKLSAELGGGEFGRIEKVLSPESLIWIDLSLTGLHCKISDFKKE